MSKAKRWCYTINNPSEEPAVPEEEFSYHVYGEEVGDSGTPHYQGFIIFVKPKRLNQVRNLISDRGHYEVTKGKNSQASDYCKKDGKYKEFGQYPVENHIKGGQANKERYERAFKQAKIGDIDSIDPDLIIKHYRTLKQIKTDYVVIFNPLITCLEYGYMVVRGLVNRNMREKPTRAPTSKTATSGGTTTKTRRMLLSTTLTILTLASAIILNGGGTIMLSLLRPKVDLFISALSGLW